MKKRAVLCMGSKNDAPVAERARDILVELGVECDVRVMSAHRTPDAVRDFALAARGAGYACVIAAAGKAAHLAGVIAAYTTLPVIGLPLSASLGGLDALLSTVQMPRGVPVASVAIDGAENAGILAAEIVAVTDDAVAQKLAEYRKKIA